MKTRLHFILISMIICSTLIACGSPQTVQEVSPTEDTASIAAAQATQAPTATSTLEPTATCTSTPTETLVPTATPNLTATAAAGTQAARASTQQAEKTAEALADLATQEAADALWTQLVEDGTVSYKLGDQYSMDDLDESWAQRNWYQWWSFDYSLSDFVIMTHVDWEIPNDSSFGVGGCGFAFRIKDNDNHLVTFITPSSNVKLGAMSPRGFAYQSFHWQNPNNPNLLSD